MSTTAAQSALSAAPVSAPEWVLTLSCVDGPGIVHAVSGAIVASGGNIEESQQFASHDTGRFFMRIKFDCADLSVEQLRASFAEVAGQQHRGVPGGDDRAPGSGAR